MRSDHPSRFAVRAEPHDEWQVSRRSISHDAVLGLPKPLDADWLRGCTVEEFNTFFGATPQPSSHELQSRDKLLCIEAKWASGEGSYPAALCRQIGVDRRVRPHSLRHSAITPRWRQLTPARRRGDEGRLPDDDPSLPGGRRTRTSPSRRTLTHPATAASSTVRTSCLTAWVVVAGRVLSHPRDHGDVVTLACSRDYPSGSSRMVSRSVSPLARVA